MARPVTEYTSHAGTESREPSFAQRVREQSGVPLDRCYQCLACTLSCPVASDMDFRPNQVLRMVQLGLKDRVLKSSTIWLCASCESCATRCPHEIDLPRVMDTLRRMALEKGIRIKGTSMPLSNRLFLQSVERGGKVNELEMMLKLKLKTRDFFSDVRLGLKLLFKGKLVFVQKTGVKSQIRAIFREVRDKA